MRKDNMYQQLEACVRYFNNLILNDLSSSIETTDCWIAGGAVRDWFSIGYCSSDIDIFFPDERNMLLASKNLTDRLSLKPTFENDKIVNFIFKKHKIQLIKAHYFKTPADTIRAFDFTVCAASVNRVTVNFHETFFIDLAKKRLVIIGLPYPLSTLQRLQKYIKRGYTICNGGLLEIAKAIQKLDLSKPDQNIFEFYPDGKVKFIRID